MHSTQSIKETGELISAVNDDPDRSCLSLSLIVDGSVFSLCIGTCSFSL